MENSLLAIFHEIWPKTMYYSPWSLAKFLSNFKNPKKSNFDCKIPTQYKNIYMYKKLLVILLNKEIIKIFII